MKKLSLLLSVIFSILFLTVDAADYTVTSTLDDGSVGTLRWAFNQVNSNGGGRILFNITSAANDGTKWMINLGSDLPAINNYNDSVIIDATSQPGYTCDPMVVIRRATLGGTGINLGYQNTAINSVTIKGLIIQNFDNGIHFAGGNGQHNVVKSCWIGLTSDGTGVYGSGITQRGIWVENTSSGYIIGGTGCDRNVISGTMQTTDGTTEFGAIHFQNSVTNSTIEGNYLGTSADGATALYNGKLYPLRQQGMRIENNSSGNTIKGNVIANTVGNGIWILSSASNVIIGNMIGVDPTGMLPWGNGGAGIRVDNTTNITIGGTTAADRNIISANGGATDSRNCGANQYGSGTDANGVTCSQGPCKSSCPDKYDATLQCGIYFSGVTYSYIKGNYIGTDSTGNSTGTSNAFGNLYAGIKIEDYNGTASVGNIIGGSDATYRNIIAGNGFDYNAGRIALGYEYKGHGIQLNKASTRNTTVSNNYVGVGADGQTPLGNRQDGVSLLGSSYNTISYNVLSDNTNGAFLQSDFSSGTSSGQPTGNTIIGNLVGTDATGTKAIGNGIKSGYIGSGIGMQHGSNTNTIGGTTAATRNIISNNYQGILITFTYDGNSNSAPNNNKILGNYIGTDINGTANLGNLHDGIAITEIAPSNSMGPNSNIIGGPQTNQGNIIAYNQGNAINISGVNADKNSITHNSIFCNALRGIELNGTGNDNYKAPQIYTTSTATQLQGSAPANSYVEVFVISSCTPTTCDPTNPSKRLQGKTFVGGVMANSAGNWTLSGTFNNFDTYTATASQTTSIPSTASAYNTSEFGTCYAPCTPPSTVTISSSGPTTICSGTTFPTLTAKTTGGVGPFTYQWFDANGAISGKTDSTFTSTAAGSYSVKVYGLGATCSTASSVTQVVVNTTPTISLAPAADTSICAGGTVNFAVTATPSGTYTYNWTTSPSGQPVPSGASGSVSPTATATYSVTVTNASTNCTSAAKSLKVTVNPNPPASISATDTSFCATGGSVTLTAPTGSYSYQWIKDGTTNLGTSQQQIINAANAGNITVAVTDINTGCNATSTATTTIANQNPVLTITPSTGEICLGASLQITARLSDSSNAPYTYVWGATNGQAAPSGADPTVTPDTNTTYTLTVTDKNKCSSTQASIPVTVDSLPNTAISLSGPATFCEGLGPAVLHAQNVAGYTYQWFDSTAAVGTNDSLLVSSVGNHKLTVKVTTGKGCSSTTPNAQTVTVYANPDVTMTPTGTANVCLGSLDTLKASANMAGAYAWYKDGVNLNKSKDTLIVSSAGTYTVVYTNTNGCTDRDSVQITFLQNNFAKISVTKPQFCAQDSLNMAATNGAIAYQWFFNNNPINGATQDIYYAKQPGDYSVYVELQGGCKDTSANLTVKMNPKPTVTAQANQTEICQGDTADISAAATNGTAPYTFAWTNGQTVQQFIDTPGATTTYSVVAKDSVNCFSDTASVTVTVNDRPKVNLTADASGVCPGDSTTLHANASGGHGTFTYNWNPSASLNPAKGADPVATPADTTTYTLVVTDTASCSSDTGSVTVLVFLSPTVAVTVDQSSICVGKTVVLSAQPSGGNGVYSYSWSNGRTDSTFQDAPTDTTQYKVTVTDGNKCSSAADSLTVNVNPNPRAPVISADGPTIFCSGDSVGIDVNAPLDTAAQYMWVALPSDSVLNTGTHYEASKSGTYSAIALYPKTGCATDAQDTVSVSVKTRPADVAISTNRSPVICAGDTVDLFVNTAADTIQWFLMGTPDTLVGTQAEYSATKAGWYAVVVALKYDTLVCSANDEDSIQVVVNPNPTVSITTNFTDSTVCAGHDVVLHAIPGPKDPGAYTYSWNATSSTDSVITVSVSGDVMVTVVDTLTLCKDSTDKVFNVKTVEAYIGPNYVDICMNTSVYVNAQVSASSNDFIYSWKVSNSPPKYTSYTHDLIHNEDIYIKGLAQGQEYYYLYVKDNVYGCEAMDSVLAKVWPLPAVTLTSDKDTVCIGTSLELYASGSAGTPLSKAPHYVFSWASIDTLQHPTVIDSLSANPADTSLKVYPNVAPVYGYIATVTDSVGCVASDTLFVHPLHDQHLSIPNLVTPNHDGKNDVLFISDANGAHEAIMPGAQLEVVNRWGEAVYKTKNYDNKWMPTNLTDGVYYYYLKAGCAGTEYKGWLQISGAGQ